jgi:uroporphyrinogen-III synthase
VNDDKKRHTKVSRLLISQPKPTNDNSPYFKLADRYNLDIDFRKFIQIEEVPYKEFRKEKIRPLDYTAVIFTSRNAVDNYYRICDEAKVEVPADMKYFCISEQTANYLQKYIVIRKRKLFVGKKSAIDLIEVLKKHKGEKFLYPCSDIRKDTITNYLSESGSEYKEAVLYRTVSSDLSDLKDVNYDLIAFFSPSGLTSLFTNFPDFEQKGTRIAAFGSTTAKAVRDAGLTLDIEAPHPNAPSMTGAIELYVKEVNNK